MVKRINVMMTNVDYWISNAIESLKNDTENRVSVHIDQLYGIEINTNSSNLYMSNVVSLFNYTIRKIAELSDKHLVLDADIQLKERSKKILGVVENYELLLKDICLDHIPEITISKQECTFKILNFERYHSPLHFEIKELHPKATAIYKEYRIFDNQYYYNNKYYRSIELIYINNLKYEGI